MKPALRRSNAPLASDWFGSQGHFRQAKEGRAFELDGKVYDAPFDTAMSYIVVKIHGNTAFDGRDELRRAYVNLTSGLSTWKDLPFRPRGVGWQRGIKEAIENRSKADIGLRIPGNYSKLIDDLPDSVVFSRASFTQVGRTGICVSTEKSIKF